MAKSTEESKIKRMRYDGLFIPAGLFIGMGLGFMFNHITAGIFLGLGLGFLVMALFRLNKN